MGIVSPAEGDPIVLKGHQTMVGDGDAMGVARQVVENMFGTAEGWLGVDDPVLLAELPEEVAERCLCKLFRLDAFPRKCHCWWSGQTAHLEVRTFMFFYPRRDCLVFAILPFLIGCFLHDPARL